MSQENRTRHLTPSAAGKNRAGGPPLAPQDAGPSRRFPRIIGRKGEIDRLEKYMLDWGANHVIYYWAAGGYGKTRLLEHAQTMVSDAGPGYYSGGIIDLFHTATHASSDVEKLIIENLLRELDPRHEKYFTNYLRERENYEAMREHGADPGELEKKRRSLSQIFIQDFHALALKVHKLVLCFDTIEIIQYESGTIERMIKLEDVDPRIRGWMLDNLPKLANVTIIFAGRSKGGEFQTRLIKDMETAFGETLEVVPLPPFSPEEMDEFFQALPDGAGVCPPSYRDLIYMLTGGRPILLHLVYDLLRLMADDPGQVYEMFDSYRPLLEKYRDVDVEQLSEIEEVMQARQKVEQTLIDTLINTSEKAGYLQKLVLLQKGFNAEIIEKVTGLSPDEARNLIEYLRELSFIKQYIPVQEELSTEENDLPHPVQTQEHRIFFHDEMVRLMTDPRMFRSLRMEERQIAQTIIAEFYDPHIKGLEERIHALEGPENQKTRIVIREELYKLLTERLYYLLLRDPKAGYEEYKRLSARASSERQPGFGMRVRDEFLRFYNPDLRREQFESRGITHDKVIKESAQLWMERFHWGGNYEKAIAFGQQVLDHPEDFAIGPQDVDILGNVCALWSRAWAMKNGYNKAVMDTTREVLRGMPALEECSGNTLLAVGRLAASVGYLARWKGDFDLAIEANGQALSAYKKLETHQEEQAMVLNNMAYAHANRGQVRLATSFGKEAIRINKTVSSRYTLGLTYTNLAAVERLARTNFTRAIHYAELALQLFSEIEDFHGLVRARLNLGSAWRETAVEEIWDQNYYQAFKHLETALDHLKEGLETAKSGELSSEIPGLRAEMGKVYRAFGQWYRLQREYDLSTENLHLAEQLFHKALEWDGWSIMDRGDILEDLATTIFESGDRSLARAKLEEVKSLLENSEDMEAETPGIPTWYYLPLGKVERLYGNIAMSENQADEALYSFASAYAFFTRFSETSVEKNQMVDQLFRRYLSGRSFGEVSQMIATLQQRIEETGCQIHGVNVTPFVDDLKSLTGVH